MARIRSPGYPNSSLKEAIEFARKIHSQDYTHPVSREVAAQHMGFSGITGTSDRAISALQHYGLARKVAKGELQLTDTAVDILLPESPAGRRAAMRRAGFSPTLFADLRAKYRGNLPSEESLSTYLMRQGFVQRAVGTAARAYLDTCRFLQQEGAYEGDEPTLEEPVESSATRNLAEEPRMTPQIERAPQLVALSSASQPSAPSSVSSLNEIRLEIEGSTGAVSARFDKRGLSRLIKKLQRLQLILDDDDDDEDAAGADDWQADDALSERS